MTGLAPGSAYWYRVGSAAQGWSGVFNFSTLPANAGTAERPLRIIQISDMCVRQGEGRRRVASARHPDLRHVRPTRGGEEKSSSRAADPSPPCRGYGPNSNATVAAIAAEVDAGTVDFVVHPGDVSYADG